MKVKSESEVTQSCPTLSDPMDCSLPGSSIRGISRQEYWSGVPFPSPGDLPNPWVEPGSPALQADALPSEPPGKCICTTVGVSLVAQTVKHLPAMQETQVQSLGGEDPLEKEMATHSSTLAWKIPWTKEPGGLQSMGS